MKFKKKCILTLSAGYRDNDSADCRKDGIEDLTEYHHHWHARGRKDDALRDFGAKYGVEAFKC